MIDVVTYYRDLDNALTALIRDEDDGLYNDFCQRWNKPRIGPAGLRKMASARPTLAEDVREKAKAWLAERELKHWGE